MFAVRQRFPSESIHDIGAVVGAGVGANLKDLGMAAGAEVAIAVGSRGVTPLGEVVAAIVSATLGAGLRPFIVPAMGSHGGATAEGQSAVLAGLGIDEAGVGAPMRSSMETALLGHTSAGVPVHLDRHALAADALIVLGRVKPHTGFRGAIESGLCKMLAVGLGKIDGARALHAAGLAATIPAAAEIILSARPRSIGVALIENAYERVAAVEIVHAQRFAETDRTLLKAAWKLLPRIPVEAADLLIVEELGKDISGTGMDPNIIGMWRRFGGERTPNFARVAALRLSRGSHGNANGIGLADFTTRTTADAIDWSETYTNALTALDPGIAHLPVTLPTDYACIETALALCRRERGGEPTVVRIRSTRELTYLSISENLIGHLPDDVTITRSASGETLAFDDAGVLLPDQRWAAYHANV